MHMLIHCTALDKPHARLASVICELCGPYVAAHGHLPLLEQFESITNEHDPAEQQAMLVELAEYLFPDGLSHDQQDCRRALNPFQLGDICQFP
jgi:hypothetical protein